MLTLSLDNSTGMQVFMFCSVSLEYENDWEGSELCTCSVCLYSLDHGLSRASAHSLLLCQIPV